MNLYYELLNKPVFTLEDINQYYNNIEAARTAVRRLIAQELIVRIRKNMYTCISGETGCPVANKYQIGSAVSQTAYISHHTAMEYYGVCDQVYYDVYVSSETPFKEFVFDGYTYCYVASKCKLGIENVHYSGGVRITDKERTTLDSIKDMDKISGIEEVLANIDGFTSLNEEKLTGYLQEYHNHFLYQKTGFILYPYRDKLGLSHSFFEMCQYKTGKSKRYLTKEFTNGTYIKEWKLVVPDEIYKLKNGAFQDDRMDLCQ